MAEWQNLEAGNATYVDDDGNTLIGCGDGGGGGGGQSSGTPLFDQASEGNVQDGGDAAPSSPPGSLLGSTMRTMEANKWNPMDIHERLGEKLHAEIQGLIDSGGDGHGEAYDMSSVLGPGAVGYLSPSGMVTLEPPVQADDGWMVKGSGPGGEAPSEAPEQKQQGLFDGENEQSDQIGPESDHQDTPENTAQSEIGPQSDQIGQETGQETGQEPDDGDIQAPEESGQLPSIGGNSLQSVDPGQEGAASQPDPKESHDSATIDAAKETGWEAPAGDGWADHAQSARTHNAVEALNNEGGPGSTPDDGIPRLSNEEWINAGDWDQSHTGLATETVQSKIAKGMEGIDNRDYAIVENKPGKWQLVSRPSDPEKRMNAGGKDPLADDEPEDPTDSSAGSDTSMDLDASQADTSFDFSTEGDAAASGQFDELEDDTDSPWASIHTDEPRYGWNRQANGKLDRAITEAIGQDAHPDQHEGMKARIHDLWSADHDNAQSINSTYNAALDQIGGNLDKHENRNQAGGIRGNLVARIQKAEDSRSKEAKKMGIDQVGEDIFSSNPEYLTPHYNDPQKENHGDALLEALKGGKYPQFAEKKRMPQPYDETYIQQVLAMQAMHDDSGYESGPTDPDEYDDFYRKNGLAIKYARWWQSSQSRAALHYANKRKSRQGSLLGDPQQSLLGSDKDETKWITIGGHAEGGKKHAGGTPVKVSGSGTIVGGPTALQGKKVDDIDKNVAGTDKDKRKPPKPKQKQQGLFGGGGEAPSDTPLFRGNSPTDPHPEPSPEGAATESTESTESPSISEIPDNIRLQIERHVEDINELSADLEKHRGFDKDMGSDGRYEFDVWDKKASQQTLENFSEFRERFDEIAKGEGYDPEEVFSHFGLKEMPELSDAAKGWGPEEESEAEDEPDSPEGAPDNTEQSDANIGETEASRKSESEWMESAADMEPPDDWKNNTFGQLQRGEDPSGLGELQFIPIGSITSHEHDTPDQDMVDMMRISDGIPLPPIVADRNSEGEWVVADGSTRLASAREAGLQNVPIRPVEYSPEGAPEGEAAQDEQEEPVEEETSVDRNDIAERVSAAINAEGYTSKIWDEYDELRVYVSRQLSKGKQDMGYIEIDEDGEINPNGLSRSKATLRDIATTAISNEMTPHEVEQSEDETPPVPGEYDSLLDDSPQRDEGERKATVENAIERMKGGLHGPQTDEQLTTAAGSHFFNDSKAKEHFDDHEDFKNAVQDHLAGSQEGDPPDEAPGGGGDWLPSGGRRVTPQVISDSSAEYAVKLSADSIEQLRKQDVYRVMDSLPDQHIQSMKSWIDEKRPELSDETAEALADLHSERGIKSKAGSLPERNEPEATPDKSGGKPEMDEMVDAAHDWKYLATKHSGTLDRDQKFEHNRATTKGDLDSWLKDKFGVDDSTARSVSNKAGEDPPFEIGRDGVSWKGDRPEPAADAHDDLSWNQKNGSSGDPVASGGESLQERQDREAATEAKDSGDEIEIPESNGRYDFKLKPTESTKEGHKSFRMNTHDSGYAQTLDIPDDAVEHAIADMKGEPNWSEGSGNDAVDAAAKGDAEFLGRGNDGAAYRAGDKVVKVSSPVSYNHQNNFFDDMESTNRVAKRQADISKELNDKGLKGIAPLEHVEHDGRAFTISDHYDQPEKVTREQAEKVRDNIKAMHEAGYSYNDEFDVGFDKNGDPQFFDVATVKNNVDEQHKKDDSESFRRWAGKHGVNDEDLHVHRTIFNEMKDQGIDYKDRDVRESIDQAHEHLGFVDDEIFGRTLSDSEKNHLAVKAHTSGERMPDDAHIDLDKGTEWLRSKIGPDAGVDPAKSEPATPPSTPVGGNLFDMKEEPITVGAQDENKGPAATYDDDDEPFSLSNEPPKPKGLKVPTFGDGGKQKQGEMFSGMDRPEGTQDLFDDMSSNVGKPEEDAPKDREQGQTKPEAPRDETLAEKVARQREEGGGRTAKGKSPEKAKPKVMATVSGAEYEFVKKNDDGTLTVQNDQGDKFSTEPGEEWNVDGESGDGQKPKPFSLGGESTPESISHAWNDRRPGGTNERSRKNIEKLAGHIHKDPWKTSGEYAEKHEGKGASHELLTGRQADIHDLSKNGDIQVGWDKTGEPSYAPHGVDPPEGIMLKEEADAHFAATEKHDDEVASAEKAIKAKLAEGGNHDTRDLMRHASEATGIGRDPNNSGPINEALKNLMQDGDLKEVGKSWAGSGNSTVTAGGPPAPDPEALAKKAVDDGENILAVISAAHPGLNPKERIGIYREARKHMDTFRSKATAKAEADKPPVDDARKRAQERQTEREAPEKEKAKADRRAQFQDNLKKQRESEAVRGLDYDEDGNYDPVQTK